MFICYSDAPRPTDGVVYPVPEEEDVGEDCRPHPGPGARAVPAAAEDGLELPLAGLRQTHQGGAEVGVTNPGVSVSLGAEAGGWQVAVVQAGGVAELGGDLGDGEVGEVLVEADPLGGGGPASRHTELSLLHSSLGQTEGTDEAVEVEAVMDLHHGEVPVHQVLGTPGPRVTHDTLHQLDLGRLAGGGAEAGGPGEHDPLQGVDSGGVDTGVGGDQPAGRHDRHRAARLPPHVEEDGEARPLRAGLQVGLAAHQESLHTVSEVPAAALWDRSVSTITERGRERGNLPNPAQVNSTFSLERHLRLSLDEDFCTRFPLTGTELSLNLKSRNVIAETPVFSPHQKSESTRLKS